MKRKLFLSLIVIFIAIGLLFIACNQTDEETVDIVDFISTSYSQRHFTDKQISDEIIRKVLIAGHRAGSAGNRQPWHFTVIRNKEIIDTLMSNVTEGNVLIVVSTPAESTNPIFSMDFDAALASQNIFLAAQALGLGARMYVRPVGDINQYHLPLLELPSDNLRVKIVIRLGYESDEVDTTTAASPRIPIEEKVNFVN